MENVSLWIKINWKNSSTTPLLPYIWGLVIHVAAEPYVYTYVATCTLLHIAKIIQQAWLYRKHVTVKFKQKKLEISFD